MNWYMQALIILGLFILRLGLPLAIVLVVGYWLHRLDRKWQAEAEAQLLVRQVLEEIGPEVIVPISKAVPRCWELKGCLAETREHCPAYHNPNQPCWLVRRRTEDRLPTSCYTCELFMPEQTLEVIGSLS